MPTLIAVGAAASGMGKSVVVSNLAASIAGLGRRVVVVDLDFRRPHQHTLLGAPPPDERLDTWLERKRARRDEPARATKIRNLRLLPCAAAPAAVVSADQRRALIEELSDLDSEVVVIDVGADNRDDLFDHFGEHALRLLVTSRETRALEATYAFLRGAARRAEQAHGTDARAVLARFAGGLIGNAIEAREDEECFHAFARLVREHLGMPLPVFGCLRHSERIVQSVVARQPLIARRGIDDNVRQFHHIAEMLMNEEGAIARDCPLAGDPIALTVAPLPADLASYARKHPRYPVDWAATLEIGGIVTEVRVRDVSASGAAAETTLKLRVGDSGLLHLDQLSGQPSVAVTVKNVVPSSNRVGLGFTDKGRVHARLVAAARAATAGPSS
jgi:flagellar biosynthesis protein FlhG